MPPRIPKPEELKKSSKKQPAKKKGKKSGYPK